MKPSSVAMCPIIALQEGKADLKRAGPLVTSCATTWKLRVLRLKHHEPSSSFHEPLKSAHERCGRLFRASQPRACESLRQLRGAPQPSYAYLSPWKFLSFYRSPTVRPAEPMERRKQSIGQMPTASQSAWRSSPDSPMSESRCRRHRLGPGRFHHKLYATPLSHGHLTFVRWLRASFREY